MFERNFDLSKYHQETLLTNEKTLLTKVKYISIQRLRGRFT